MLLCCEAARQGPIFQFSGTSTAVLACDRIDDPGVWPSLSSLESGQSRVSSLQCQGSSFHCQASSVVMCSRDPGQNLEGQPR